MSIQARIDSLYAAATEQMTPSAQAHGEARQAQEELHQRLFALRQRITAVEAELAGAKTAGLEAIVDGETSASASKAWRQREDERTTDAGGDRARDDRASAAGAEG